MRPRSLQLAWHSHSYPKGDETRADIIDEEGFGVLRKLDPELASHLSFLHNAFLIDVARLDRLSQRDELQRAHERGQELMDREGL